MCGTQSKREKGRDREVQRMGDKERVSVGERESERESVVAREGERERRRDLTGTYPDLGEHPFLFFYLMKGLKRH